MDGNDISGANSVTVASSGLFVRIWNLAWAMIFSALLVAELLTVPLCVALVLWGWRWGPTAYFEPGGISGLLAIGLMAAALADTFAERSLLRRYPGGLAAVLPNLKHARPWLRVLLRSSLCASAAGFIIYLSLSEGGLTILTSGWPVSQQQQYYIIGNWRGVITVSRWRYDAIGGSRLMGALAGLCWFYGVALRGLWFGELPWQTQRTARSGTMGRRLAVALLVLLGLLVAIGLAMPAY